MAKRKVGGFFTKNVTDAAGVVTRVTDWKSIMVLILTIVVVGAIIGVVLYFTLSPKKESPEEPSGGGSVAPSYSKIPGSITIAEVTQAPSAGQGIIYFSQAQAAGTVCDTCTAMFDINLTYSGGQPVPPPSFKQLTASSTSGVLTFDYSVPTQSGGTTPPLPTPPTQVSVQVTARSVSSQDPSKTSGPTTFTKTIPYVA